MFREGGVARIVRRPVALYARFVILDSGEKPELLQNCLMLVNAILIRRTIEGQELWAQLKPEDFRALTPLLMAVYRSVPSGAPFRLAMMRNNVRKLRPSTGTRTTSSPRRS